MINWVYLICHDHKGGPVHKFGATEVRQIWKSPNQNQDLKLRNFVIHQARWPSGLRRWIQAKASTRTLEIPILPECVGSNPTLVIKISFLFFLYQIYWKQISTRSWEQDTFCCINIIALILWSLRNAVQLLLSVSCFVSVFHHPFMEHSGTYHDREPRNPAECVKSGIGIPITDGWGI